MIKKLEKFELFLGTLFLAIFVVTIFIQVICRYLRIMVIWTEEVANFSFIWAMFLGAAVMVSQQQHFRFTTLMDKLQGRSKVVLRIVINLLMLAFELALMVYGWQIAMRFWNNVLVVLYWIKKGVVYLILPITGASMSVFTLSHLVADFKLLFSKEMTA